LKRCLENPIGIPAVFHGKYSQHPWEKKPENSGWKNLKIVGSFA